MIVTRSTVWTSMLLAASLACYAVPAYAGGTNSRPPAATLSDGAFSGISNISDGITPAGGESGGGFTYGGEAGLGTATTVIDITLPGGVSLAHGCDIGFGDLCVIVDTNCNWSTNDPTQAVTTSGNTISFRLACDIGEGFGFDFLTDSLITNAGLYDTSLQFKTTTLRRTPKANNMWQIKMPGTFQVGA